MAGRRLELGEDRISGSAAAAQWQVRQGVMSERIVWYGDDLACARSRLRRSGRTARLRRMPQESNAANARSMTR